jgi:DNA polymerase elongation subunit (family B)
MDVFEIDNEKSAQEFIDYIQDNPKINKVENNVIFTEDCGQITVSKEFSYILEIAKDYVSTIVLSNGDFDSFVDELENPSEPNQSFNDAKESFNNKYPYKNHFIFGKNEQEKIVSVEVLDQESEAVCVLFLSDGKTLEFTYQYWLLAPIKYDSSFQELEGQLHYRYIKFFNTKQEFIQHIQAKQKFRDYYIIWDEAEQAMVLHGITLFKGMKPENLSVLSFDIEASGLVRDHTSKVFMISNTFRKDGETIRKTFTVNQFNDNSVLMITNWAKWVSIVDPDIIIAHNGYGYDLDYMNHICRQAEVTINIGRDDSPTIFKKKESSFRVDGSNAWSYKKCKIFGRQFVDTMFLSVRYDISRNFPSWKLKEIVQFKVDELLVEKAKEKKKFKKQEVLDRWSHGGNRQYYDAGKINEDWYDKEKRKLIIRYGEQDSDDALNLYELMIPSFFYMSQSVPKTLTSMCTSASGSQLNMFLVRSYLQEGHSIPKATEYHPYPGAISFGVPGLYKNVAKIDIVSMYPSIMLQYNVHCKEKDPKNHFGRMVDFFTKERLRDKKLFKETGDKYYDDLQLTKKNFINSSYGLLGASGLPFNYIEGADFVTKMGRNIIKKTIYWASGKSVESWFQGYDGVHDEVPEAGEIKIPKTHNFLISNTDTDSISVTKANQSPFSDEEMNQLIDEINGLMPEKVKFDNDGYFHKVLILKAKNYVLQKEKKGPLKLKGSSIKDQKKELALQEFIKEIINALLNEEKGKIIHIYQRYCKEVIQETIDITRWSVKKSITSKVLEGTRKNETDVQDAIENIIVQEGDKVRLFRTNEDKLALETEYNNNHNKEHLLNRIYDTITIFQLVFDIDAAPCYNLKKYNSLLEDLQ